MKRGQAVALVLGAAIGVSGVALGVLLAREEGRTAAKRFLDQYGSQASQVVTPFAQNVASQAVKVGSQVAQKASEQGQVQLPKVRDALNGVLAQAPQTAGALVGAFSRGSSTTTPLNGATSETPSVD